MEEIVVFDIARIADLESESGDFIAQRRLQEMALGNSFV